MNILFITPSPPSRFHRIRALNLIKYLSRSHKIYLASLTDQRNPDPTEFTPYCQKIDLIYQSKIRSLLACLLFSFTPVPLEVAYCRNRKMNEAVQEIIKKKSIELIYIKRLRSAQFVDSTIRVPIIIDTTDAMSLFYRRAFRNAPWYKKLLFWEEWLKYALYEKKMFARFRVWIASSPEDIVYLKNRAPSGTQFSLIPNGVDTNFFQRTTQSPEKHSLLLSGLMDKFVNSETVHFFVRDILPKIRIKIPDVLIYIVGPNPLRSVKRLASKNILVTGEVPDIRTYIARCEVVVVPIKTAAGTRNKILQAWAMGRPVVTTSRGLEGLEAEEGKHVLIGDNPEEFAEKVVSLLRNQEIKEPLIHNGFHIVGEKYSMDIIIKELNKLLLQVKENAQTFFYMAV